MGADPNEIKKLKDQLEAARNHRHQHLEFMARMLSHNLRAPMAGMKMLLPLLEKVDEKDRPGVTQNLREAAGMLFRMIDDLSDILMDYRHLNDGFENVELGTIVNGVKSDKDEMISSCRAIITTELELKSVHYPLDHLRIIFSELLDNALKFCPGSRSPHIHICSYKEGDKVMLSITDNATGIDLKRYGEDLFKMYKSLRADDLEETPTGRGLFRVKNLVEINGGKISAESALGKGSTFFVELYRE